MESQDQIRKAIRSILEDHGIMDKDKLDHIPEAITVYIFNGIMSAIVEIVQGIAEDEIRIVKNSKELE